MLFFPFISNNRTNLYRSSISTDLNVSRNIYCWDVCFIVLEIWELFLLSFPRVYTMVKLEIYIILYTFFSFFLKSFKLIRYIIQKSVMESKLGLLNLKRRLTIKSTRHLWMLKITVTPIRVQDTKYSKTIRQQRESRKTVKGLYRLVPNTTKLESCQSFRS